jgi:CheY-like chemotaxis protein
VGASARGTPLTYSRKRAMTILLVDDELEYRLLICTVLTSRGYDVTLAENGREALEKIQGLSPDLVITDIYMPVMDGIKMSRALRGLPEFEKVPILYLSGYDDQHTLDAVKDPRCEGFLRKGTPLAELVQWIEYLTTPAEMRPAPIPKGTQTRTSFRPRDGNRTYMNSPIL